MRQVPYICVGGSYFHGDDPALIGYYRSAGLHPAPYEDMHAFALQVKFIDLHMNRLRDAMAVLSLADPPGFSRQIISELIKGLLIKNRLYLGACIRLVVFIPSAEGQDLTRGNASFLIESCRVDCDRYVLNEKGLTVDLFPAITVADELLLPVRCARSYLYRIAGQYAVDNRLDTCILLNGERKLAETPCASLFLVRDNALFTPDLNQGCAPGVMRQIVIQIAGEAGLRMNDQCSLSPSSLDEADEVFLAHDIKGIQWVGAYRKKRYYKKISLELVRRLNALAFGKSS